MARRYETITELYSKTVAGLAAPQAWQSFLTTACHNFRLPFDEQVLLYAQRPDATACAEYDLWNNRMGRYVRRGSKGIALVDDSGGQGGRLAASAGKKLSKKAKQWLTKFPMPVIL